MTNAYDKIYLEKAQTVLGRMTDYAVYDLEYAIDEIFDLFIKTGYAKRFENPLGGYGGRFTAWVYNNVESYSCGNGSAMRVGPCGCFDDIRDDKDGAEHGRVFQKVHRLAAQCRDDLVHHSADIGRGRILQKHLHQAGKDDP